VAIPHSFSRWLATALLPGLLLVPAGSGAAEQTDLATDTVRLAWDERGVVTSWDVSLPEPGAAGAQWRSLVSEADAEQISRHLALSLPGVASWEPLDPRNRGDGLASQWLSEDGDWRLAIALTASGQPWRSKLEVTLQAVNAGNADSLQLQFGPGLGEMPMEGLGIARSLYSYTEAVAYRNGEVIRMAEVEDGPIQVEQGDWLGLHSRYFALLAAPVGDSAPIRAAAGTLGGIEVLPAEYLPWIRLQLPVGSRAAGETLRWRLDLFSGPKTQAALLPVQHEHGADYSPLLFNSLWDWMRGLSLGLLWVLETIYALVPNWGVAICLLAVIVRLLLYPLGRWALSSQQRFAEVQAEIAPDVRDIKNRYRGAEQSERILQLYERRGVSPLAGLKPLLIVLIQVPVFVALFHVLGQVFEFRDASFLWIDSLAEPDRLFAFGISLPFFGSWFNLLPVLMAVTTLASIKLSPAPASSASERRRQNLFLGLMAIAFFLLFYPFPSGMVLYWCVANLLHIVQVRMSGPAQRRP
jgi:YidC/Oxa1 family membrane protein insertase